jgi:sugar-specific transcriptional regulator TrmB
MVNNKDMLLERLRALGLNIDEARVYLELLKGPATHLKLARATGVNRSKIYRLADGLEKRSLINVRSDDRGTFLIASDPTTLEIELVTEEERLKSQRQAFESLLPVLKLIKNSDASSFIVHTYEGVEGFKQMLWHELKTKNENLVFGCGSLHELVGNQRWIQQHEERLVAAGYHVREIINPGESEMTFTFEKHRVFRVIPKDILSLESQLSIYNDTVAIYHWRREQKVGLEIMNAEYANTMRQMFQAYWVQATATDR